MQKINKEHAIGFFGMAALIVAFFIGFQMLAPKNAHANPSSFCYDQTASATTSQISIGPGRATTTLTVANCLDRAIALTKAVVDIQYIASSTVNARMNMRVEHSFDGIDWFSSSAPLITSGTTATTTQVTGNFADFQMSFASSTVDQGASGSLVQFNTSVQIPIDAPYTRVKFYQPLGTGNGLLFARMVGVREIGGR